MMEKETLRNEIRERIKARIKERIEGKGEVILLTQDECSACRMVKEFASNAIKAGKVRIIDINTEEGNGILNKLGLSTVPVPVKKDAETYSEMDLKEFMYRFGNSSNE